MYVNDPKRPGLKARSKAQAALRLAQENAAAKAAVEASVKPKVSLAKPTDA